MGSSRPAVQRVHCIDDRGDSRMTTERLSVNRNRGIFLFKCQQGSCHQLQNGEETYVW